MLTVQEVLAQLRGLKSMSELSSERYSEETGLAFAFVSQLPKGKLKPTQIRKVFHQVKDIQKEFKKGGDFNRARVALIMPTLAYSVGRDLIPKEFYELMKLCFGSEKCKTRQDFESAANFLEAIMAYHKYNESL